MLILLNSMLILRSTYRIGTQKSNIGRFENGFCNQGLDFQGISAASFSAIGLSAASNLHCNMSDAFAHWNAS